MDGQGRAFPCLFIAGGCKRALPAADRIGELFACVVYVFQCAAGLQCHIDGLAGVKLGVGQRDCAEGRILSLRNHLCIGRNRQLYVRAICVSTFTWRLSSAAKAVAQTPRKVPPQGQRTDTFSYAFSFSVLRVYGKVKRHRIAVITGIQGLLAAKCRVTVCSPVFVSKSAHPGPYC